MAPVASGGRTAAARVLGKTQAAAIPTCDYAACTTVALYPDDGGFVPVQDLGDTAATRGLGFAS